MRMFRSPGIGSLGTFWSCLVRSSIVKFYETSMVHGKDDLICVGRDRVGLFAQFDGLGPLLNGLSYLENKYQILCFKQNDVMFPYLIGMWLTSSSGFDCA